MVISRAMVRGVVPPETKVAELPLEGRKFCVTKIFSENFFRDCIFVDWEADRAGYGISDFGLPTHFL